MSRVPRKPTEFEVFLEQVNASLAELLRPAKASSAPRKPAPPRTPVAPGGLPPLVALSPAEVLNRQLAELIRPVRDEHWRRENEDAIRTRRRDGW